MLAGTDCTDIGVVVFAGECRRRRAPDQGGANTVDFVGGHLLAVAASAEDDSQGLDTGELVATNAERRVDAKAGVIIERVEFDGSVIDHLVPLFLAVGGDNRTQFHAGVIGCEMDAHG